MNQLCSMRTPRGPFRVLTIDRKGTFRSTLELLGTQCHLATYSTAEMITAIRMMRSHWPQVVLLNLEIPRVDACAIARELRLVLQGRNCLMIAVAAWMNELRRRRCADADIDVVLMAPIDRDNLETLLMLELDLVNRQHYSTCCQAKNGCRNEFRLANGCRQH